MNYADCRIGMRVRIKDRNQTGVIDDLVPVLNVHNVPKEIPRVMFNVVKVRLDPPYELVKGQRVIGNVELPENLEPLLQ